MLTVVNAHMRVMLAKFKSDEGAGIVEYVLLVVAIALLVLVAMQVLGGALSNQFNNVSARVNTANTPN